MSKEPQPRRNLREKRRAHAHRLRYQSQTWGGAAPNPESLKTAYAMTVVGVLGMVGFVLALMNDGARYATPLLLVGASMLLFGSLTLLVASLEWAWKRVSRTKKHCGRCVFYQPQNDDYEVGLCRADPREGFVQRTHSCPYFRYSERAMVRDRLAQKPELLKTIKVVRVESDEQEP